MTRTPGSTLGVILATSAAVTMSACAWQPYLATRAVRYATGARTRVHQIVPLASLKTYRVIEVRRLENLLPGRIPPRQERYLGDRIIGELAGVRSSPRIVRPADDSPADAIAETTPSSRTLIVDGFVDDYDPGSVPLRIVELGFNHVAVTVRIRLRDKQSGAIVGAASVTAEDNRATGTTTAAINQVAKRVRTFVNSGYEK